MPLTVRGLTGGPLQRANESTIVSADEPYGRVARKARGSLCPESARLRRADDRRTHDRRGVSSWRSGTAGTENRGPSGSNRAAVGGTSGRAGRCHCKRMVCNDMAPVPDVAMRERESEMDTPYERCQRRP